MQACIFDWYFAKQTGQPCDPNNGRQLSQNSFKAWATIESSVAWYSEHGDMGETWHRLRVDGWTAVSSLPKYRGIRMAAGLLLNQTREPCCTCCTVLGVPPLSGGTTSSPSIPNEIAASRGGYQCRRG